MRKYALITAALLAAIGFSPAYAVDTRIYVSDPDLYMCARLSDAQKFQSVMEQGDAAAAGRLIQNDACSVIKPPMKFYITETHGNVVGVRRAGMTDTVYTFRHMLH